jgi:hypothetical protein
MSRVYFIRPIGMEGPIKVGCSASPDGRRKTLETWSPFALEIIAEIEGDVDLERRFHALFQETHLRREWFGWSKRIAAVIDAVRAGSFDVDTLPSPICISANPRKGKGSRAGEWNEQRRFASAYHTRMQALRRRGMSHEEWFAKPHLQTHGHWLGFGKGYRPHTANEIRAAEQAAAEMTKKYGHDRLKPLLWRGPLPDVESTAA